MPHRYLVRAVCLTMLMAVGLSAIGCSGGSIDGQGGSELAVVEGVVTEKEDMVPVDGGVTLKVRRDNGTTQTLYFESMFTMPPPSEAHVALYQTIQLIKIGDHIRASGTPTDDHISIETIELLTRK